MLRACAMMGLALAACSAEPTSAPAARPDLALLTSLPILFGERFGLDAPKSPLLDALEASYAVRPVDGPEQLAPGGLLLAAQPQALTAERLVALDDWVRQGGRLVLLADPMLTFESSRPLGDRFRPPYAFPDTGLLRRWGLSLDAQEDAGAEQAETDLGRGTRIRGARPGSLTRAGGDCTLSPTRAVARCRVGKGYATIVADADFALGEPAGNREAVVALVGELATPPRN
ncbi:DUF4350 domain-containing protein [Sphingomonas sp. LHG3406-1]|uniref:DUF4350 domain-containing protein n=1 Tax=Sphingomonas sp. LHG3406-1 TaxID=2804617 RepID=UPI002635C15A|nr:DUF4350 domain-containing protein [Sphingomonas sp. LHG3406-1]